MSDVNIGRLLAALTETISDLQGLNLGSQDIRAAVGKACKSQGINPASSLGGGGGTSAPARSPRDLDLLKQALAAGEWRHLMNGTKTEYRRPGGNPGFCHSKIGACGIGFDTYDTPRYWAKGIGVACEACFAAGEGTVAPMPQQETERPAWMQEDAPPATPEREPGDETEAGGAVEQEEMPF